MVYFILLIVCVCGINAGEIPENAVFRDIMARLGELEQRGRIQQLEIHALQKENQHLKETVETQVVRIAALEDQSLSLFDKAEYLDERVAVCQTGNSTNSTKQESSRKHDSEKTDQGRQSTQNHGNHPTNKVSPQVLKRQSLENGDMDVAFFTTLTNHQFHLGDHQAIIFDNVITNVGTAYNPHSGLFTAPVPGLYVFSATVLGSHTSTEYDIAVNGKMVSRMWVYAESSTNVYQTTSQTAILHLGQRDDVTIRIHGTDEMAHGQHYSTFSGFLLLPNDLGSSVVG